MSTNKVLTDGEGVRYSYDNINVQGWLRGHSPGLDAAVEWLKERSVALFREGQDDGAVRLRKLADEMHRALRPAMEARARQHAKEWPVVMLQEDSDD